jgi:DNA polymerase III delta subunit
MSPEEIGKATGMKWPNLRDAAIRRAGALGQDGLAAAFAALVEADRRQKLGEIDDDLALEVAIGKLAMTAAAAAAAAKRQARPPATPRRQPAAPRR